MNSFNDVELKNAVYVHDNYFHVAYASHDEEIRPVMCKIVGVYDGDTCTCKFRLFNNPSLPLVQCKVRLFGIDTEELKFKSQIAFIARDELKKYLGSVVYIIFEKKYDKYGRLLGTLYTSADVTQKSINATFIEKGLAKSYDGGKKE